jgi:hypothetical protein
MIRFFYDAIRKRCGDNARSLFTDTDSFVLPHLDGERLRRHGGDHGALWHRRLPRGAPLHSNANTKVVGEFK